MKKIKLNKFKLKVILDLITLTKNNNKNTNFIIIPQLIIYLFNINIKNF